MEVIQKAFWNTLLFYNSYISSLIHPLHNPNNWGTHDRVRSRVAGSNQIKYSPSLNIRRQLNTELIFKANVNNPQHILTPCPRLIRLDEWLPAGMGDTIVFIRICVLFIRLYRQLGSIKSSFIQLWGVSKCHDWLRYYVPPHHKRSSYCWGLLKINYGRIIWALEINTFDSSIIIY